MQVGNLNIIIVILLIKIDDINNVYNNAWLSTCNTNINYFLNIRRDYFSVFAKSNSNIDVISNCKLRFIIPISFKQFSIVNYIKTDNIIKEIIYSSLLSIRSYNGNYSISIYNINIITDIPIDLSKNTFIYVSYDGYKNLYYYIDNYDKIFFTNITTINNITLNNIIPISDLLYFEYLNTISFDDLYIFNKTLNINELSILYNTNDFFCFEISRLNNSVCSS